MPPLNRNKKAFIKLEPQGQKLEAFQCLTSNHVAKRKQPEMWRTRTKSDTRVGLVAQQVRMLLGTPTFHFQVLGIRPALVSDPASC